MSIIYKTLKKFGLSDNEIKVYLEAVKHENLSPFKLAKLTGIPRTTVYDVVMGLSLKGLIELQQSKGFEKQQTRIKAKNPSGLRTILQKKRQDLVSLELDIINVLPEIKGKFHKDKTNADFKFYPGIKGVKKVYLEELDGNIDLPIYAWDLLMPMDVFGADEMNEMVKRETKVKIKFQHRTKEILPLNKWTKHVLTYQIGRDEDYLKTREIRLIEKSSFKLYQRIAFQGNWLRITCAKKDEVWGLVINSPLLVKSLKSIFNINWEMAEPLTLKMVKSWGENEFLKEEKRRVA